MTKASILSFAVSLLLAATCAVQGFVPTQSQQRLRYPLGAAVADVDESSKADSETKTLSLFSPCKINLFLRIIRKREDGFHDLASLFQAVGFGDTLELTPLEKGATQDEFDCNMEGVPVDDSNPFAQFADIAAQQPDPAQMPGAGADPDPCHGDHAGAAGEHGRRGAGNWLPTNRLGRHRPRRSSVRYPPPGCRG